MRTVPDLIVMAPMDENELKDMLYFAADYDKGPVSIRYPRGSGTANAINNEPRPIEIGKAGILKEGSDGWILAIGEMVAPSVSAAEELEKEDIKMSVVNMRFVAPLDSALLDSVAVSGKPVFTVEENIINGGFGSAVSEYFMSKGIVPDITVIGIPMEFTVQATRKRLLEIYGLNPKSIVEKIKKGLGR
jgi:1-deoxy-D-xylulose-5-phosphate synthase